jgi:predicted DNA-binding transcriptional regulator YafY
MPPFLPFGSVHPFVVFHPYTECTFTVKRISTRTSPPFEALWRSSLSSGAVVVLYVDSNGIEARVMWPATTDNYVICRGYRTPREEYRNFPLDRIVGCHPIGRPDDYDPATG